MSRVEEARRRASGRHIENRYPDATVTGRSFQDSALEDYPRERRGDSERVAPVQAVRRPVAAPRSASTGHLGSLDEALEGKLVGSADTPPLVVEQYRRLGASLHELQVDTGLKTLMVTSAMPREGKTLTVTNLALTLSGSYQRRVLLIDADLRRPSLHGMFRLPKTTGLSEAIRSGTRPHLVELSPLLSVLPAGELERDPMSALTSNRFAELVQECASAFDWAILDAPPVGLMPDGNVIARVVKAVVLVIAAGMTSQRLIERAIAEIGREHIVGTVLNRADEGAASTMQYYQAYYTESDRD